MKELRISLSDETVEALEAGVAAGDAASVEELVQAAVGAFLDPGLDPGLGPSLAGDPGMPTREEMRADLAEADRELAAGARLYSADEVRQFLDETADE